MKNRIALIYDRANTAYGGAEQVLLAIQKIYPEATLFSSVYNPQKAKWTKKFKQVKTSFLQKIPFASNFYRYLVALMPLAFENLDLSTYEIVISVTSAEAKGVITRRDQLHLCYLLSPPRYLYHYQEQYLHQNHLLRLPLINSLTKSLLSYLKKWDQSAIFRPDLIIPIAQIVKKRAEKYYPHIDLAPVIYPPINTTLIKNFPSQDKPMIKGNYLLLVGRLVPYKNIAAAILACQQSQKKLVIVGAGPEEKRLKKLSKKLNSSQIIFKKYLDEQSLANLYQHCQAVLSPGLDDFSLVALEANLFGKPVIINRLAGAAELIKNEIHGLHLPYTTKDSEETIAANLIKSIKKLEHLRFEPASLRKNALKYDTNEFVLNFGSAVNKAYQAKKEGKL